MVLTIKKTTEENIEIKLPAFYKSIAYNFKIYSETNCIAVTQNDIGIKHAELAFCGSFEESNELEFLTAYNETLEKIDLITKDF